MRQAESPASDRGVMAAEPCRSQALPYKSIAPWMLLTAIAVLAFNLRTGLASLPPLLGAIRGLGAWPCSFPVPLPLIFP